MPSITQYALMCGKLSSISRLTAIVLQVHQADGFGMWLRPRVVRVERQRDERLEAARLVLQFAQADQVVDAVLGASRCGRRASSRWSQAQFVRLAVDPHHSRGVGLVLADLVAHVRVEDLRAAARQAAQAGVLDLGQDLAVGRPVRRANQSHSTAVHAFRCSRG